MLYVYIFILCVVSVTGRVAVSEHRDEVSNSVVDIKPVVDKTNTDSNHSQPVESKPSESVINQPTPIAVPPSPNIKFVTNDGLLSLRVNNKTSNLLLNFFLNFDPKTPEVPVDNGTALLLSQYLKSGKVKEARMASKVDSSIFLGIKSYSGYFTVNETYNSNIFFWYFPVLDKPVNESPWMVWLQGGPGASSMTGLFDELGPFSVENNTLKLNPHTWLRNHSLVFIENPVGTGFSFTDHDDGYVTDMETYGSHLYSTLKQFLQVFPELRTTPLYLAGESYAGKYVPAMAMEIHKGNQANKNSGINLQGLIMGNAFIDPDMISHTALPFYYFGLLDKEQIDTVQPLIDSFHEDIKANKSVEAKKKWTSLISVLIFLTHQKHAYNFLRDQLPIGKYIEFLKTSAVKKALHVGDIKFGFVNMTVNEKLAPDFLSTTKPMVEKLLEHYKVLAYCGHLDQMLPCVFTSENYRKWSWNGSAEFKSANRFPYIYENKLSGYHKSGGNLTEVVIRGAGHMVPLDLPAPTQTLVARWTHGKPLSARYGIRANIYFQEVIKNSSLTTYL